MSSEKFARAFNSGVAAARRGELRAARKHFTKALKQTPEHAALLHHLGLTCQQLGDLDAAAKYLRRSVKADPSDPVVSNNLGNVLTARSELDDAVDAYEKSVALKPDYVNALYNLAKALVRLGRFDQAIEAYRRVLSFAPGDLEARNELGAALMDAGRYDEAGASFRDALAVDPNHAESHNNLGVFLIHKGDLETARRCFGEALSCDPGYARAYENLARSRRFGSEDDAMVEQLEGLLERNQTPPEDRMLCHFALGKIYDDRQQHEPAFRHYLAGNRIKRQSVNFDPQQHVGWVDRVVDTFSPGLFEAKAGYGSDSELPVFVIGMIRSGTTLVEQIVSSHPAVSGAGELLYISDIAQALPQSVGSREAYPACIPHLTKGTAAELAESYLAKLRRKHSDALRITDKLPTNFLFLGLIALLLPKARVIHCLRDPMDVGVSIFFQRFAQGHDYAYDLSDIAAYTVQYVRLMEHWKSVLPMPIHEVRYESLVNDQEQESRKLIDFCGLEWDEACLQFERSERVVSTASNWQVRQPVYHRSVQRWRHYEPFLGPLRDALGALAEADPQETGA